MNKQLILVISSVVLSLLFASCSSNKPPQVGPKTDHYQITNVNVIDVINHNTRYGVNVEVAQGKIVAITETLKLSEKSITTIEGKGRYLIPGLWDNHSTIMTFAPEIDYPLYIANGVTSIRSTISCPNEDEVSLYACMKDKAAWKAAVEKEEMLGPTVHGWGTFPVNGPKKRQHPDAPEFHDGSTPKEAEALIEHYMAYPEADRPINIKTYNWLPKDSYFALAKHAKKAGIKLAGHKPRAVTLEEAIDAGQNSIAHARVFLYDCSNKAEEIRAGAHRKSKLTTLYPWLMENFDEASCQDKYEYMAASNTYLNPTLMTRRNDYYGVAGMFEQMKGLDYAHSILMTEWQEDIDKHGENLSPEEVAIFKDFYELTSKTVADAQKAGVKILAGSDSWSEYNVPGFSLHEELAALSDAGIDNYSVLQAATINGASFFEIADETGSIDIGKNADMVLLDANPIEDITNTQKVAVVFKGSQIYRQQEINQLKSDVKDIANGHGFTVKIIWQLLQNPTGF